MKRRTACVATALLVLAGSSQASAQTMEMTSVDIVDVPRPQERWGYAPRTQRVIAGSWVTWSNAGEDAHSVTAVDGSFDSFELGPSEGFSWYFEQPGAFEYFCTLHEWMVGAVVVDEPVMDEAPAEDPQ